MLKNTFSKMSLDKENANKSILEEFDELYLNIINNSKFNIKEELIKGMAEDMNNISMYEYIANTSASYISKEPAFNKLSVIYELKKLYFLLQIDNSKNLENLEKIKNLYEKQNKFNLISEKYYEFIINNYDTLINLIDHDRDKLIDIFGIKTLQRSYLLKDKNNVPLESPQMMFLRCAIQIHFLDIISDFSKFNLIKETYDNMSQLYFTHATPTLFNSGGRFPQLSSCYLLQCPDDLAAISKSISDMMMISKWAGGIGVNLTDIRANGALIKSNGGKSTGIIPLCKVLESVARYINQSGKRQGSIATYLEPWHYDIFDFIDLRKNTGDENLRARDLFLGLWVPNAFMRAVEKDEDWYLMSPDVSVGLTDVHSEEFDKLYYKYVEEGNYIKKIKAIDLYKKILESQLETGMPYMLYKDHANSKSNQKNLGTIKNSNLCVAPETKILTDKGYIEISTLKNKKVNVWNGEKFSKVKVMQTGKNRKLIRINFSNYEYLDCTPYHKFHIFKTKSKTEIVEASKLKAGMKIIKFDLPTIDSKEEIVSPYTAGLFSADGTYDNAGLDEKRCNYKIHSNKFCQRHMSLLDHETDTNCYLEIDDGICIAKSCLKKPRIDLYGIKKNLAQFLDVRDDIQIIKGEKRDTVRLNCDLPEKYFVPINCSINTKLKWFAGLCDGDGCVCTNMGNKSIQISSIHLDFLKQIRLMLTTLGVNPKISLLHEKQNRNMPDGKGGQKLFECKACYRLLLTSNHLYKLNELGFKTNRLDNTCPKPQRDAATFISITNIEDLGRKDDTYCFNEPEKHLGIFNGIMTGNCSEIIEYSSADEIAVCNLASICLPKFVEEVEGNKKFNFKKLGEIVKIVVNNLNKIINVNFYPVIETQLSNFRHRPIGLGVQGLACCYAKMNFPFDSEDAIKLNKMIFECIYYHALLKSNELAKELGPYDTFNGSPFSEGKLQFHLAGFSENDMNKELDYNWTTLISDIKEFGTRNSLLTTIMPTASTAQIMNNNESIEPFASNIYVRKTIAGDFIIVNKYLIEDLKKIDKWTDEIYQELVFDNGSVQKLDIPIELKEKYKTAYEMKQSILLKQSVDRSIFIDQSQSLNIFMAKPDFNKLHSCHMYSWKNGLKTGMYYLRSQPVSEGIKFGIDSEIIKIIKNKRNIDEFKNDEILNKKSVNYNNDVCETCSA
jgi:ribonucleoside-diphosphate reductase alpha chain